MGQVELTDRIRSLRSCQRRRRRRRRKMKGSNSFKFCQSTMIDIVQHYLDKVMLKSEGLIRVTGVEEVNIGTDSGSFMVKTESLPGKRKTIPDPKFPEGTVEQLGKKPEYRE